MLRRLRSLVVLLLLALTVVVFPIGTSLANRSPFGSGLTYEESVDVVSRTRPGLRGLLELKSRARFEGTRSFIDRRRLSAMDALKRLRSPEFDELLMDVAGHSDWRVRHRALLALEEYQGPDVFRTAWYALDDDEPQVRVRAAITCIRTLDKKEAKKLQTEDPAERIESWLRSETVPQVAGALRALLARWKGRLKPRTLQPECVLRGDDGVDVVAVVRSTAEAVELVPKFIAQPRSESNGRGASSFDATRPWTEPMIGFRTQEIAGATLRKFGDAGEVEGTLHTGVDVGPTMDGAGLFAVANGIVQSIRSGHGKGTEIVVQHHLGGGRLIHAVYRHAAPTVFVRAGTRVESGDLLGSIGMAFSAGNGGVPAHLDFGLRRVGTEADLSLADRPAALGLTDWYDPEKYLSEWMTVTQPLAVHPGRCNWKLVKAYALVESEKLAAAVAEATKVQTDEKMNEGSRGMAAWFIGEIRGQLFTAFGRAGTIRDLGYPEEGLEFVRRLVKSCSGLDETDGFRDLANKWAREETFQKAVEAERAYLALEQTLVTEVDQEGARAAAVKALEELASRNARTSVARRIRMRIEAAQAK